jgi:hypothetical protein
MSLCSLRSARRRLGLLAGPVLGICLVALFSGCGRTPPEAFWQPSGDDSAAINSIVEANKAYFKVGLAELAMTYCDTVLPGTTATIFRKDLRGNPFKQRFRMDAFQHVFFTDSYDLKYTFIANLDSTEKETTCTVTLAETIPGLFKMHAFVHADSLRESLFFPSPGETLRLPFYDTVMTPVDTVIDKRINGISTDGCVLKKENGQWRLWKYSGGTRFFAPGPEDAPYIFSYYLQSANRLDTVTLRPDTLHYGIQRFFSVDTNDMELLSFDRTDWLKLSRITTNLGTDAANYLYFNGKRFEASDTIKLDSVSPGIHRLYVEHIPAALLWEVKGKYIATIWGIPIMVK